MASSYTDLGIEKMATGENAGTWGTKTNTNLQIIEQISGGYTAVNFGSDADVALSVSDGSTGAALAHRVLEFTSSGSLTATRNCTIPLDVQNFYILKNKYSNHQRSFGLSQFEIKNIESKDPQSIVDHEIELLETMFSDDLLEKTVKSKGIKKGK